MAWYWILPDGLMSTQGNEIDMNIYFFPLQKRHKFTFAFNSLIDTGGPSIIPTQALNIDCTCFFEMYHISRQSFLYLKSFYIGELHPATQLKNSDIKPSDGFLQSLRAYTDQWRVTVEEKVDQQIHKSL